MKISKGNHKPLIKEGQILLWQNEREKMINDGWQYPTQKTSDWATQNSLIKGGWTKVLSIDKHFLIDYWHPLWYSCLSRGRGKKDMILTMRKRTYPCSFVTVIMFGLVSWCLAPLSTIFQWYSGGFIGVGNWNTKIKPLTCHKSLTNLIT